MTPNERLFKPEYAPELMRLAGEDLRAARILFDGKARPETILFLLEQAVEKALKAVICHKGQPVPLTHDLEVILCKLVDENPPGGYELSELTPYGTIRRYEESRSLLTSDELKASLDAGQKVVAWAHKRLEAQKK